MRRRGSGRLQHFTETIDQLRRLEDCPQQHEAFAGVAILGYQEHRMTQLWVSGELLGAVYQPQVKAVLSRAQIAGELGVVALWIVDQVTGMNFEKARQQHARRISEMRPGAALYLIEVRLAEST